MSSPTAQRRIVRVRLDGFRGHHIDVPVAPLTVLTGPNMTGKTSVLDGVSLALSGRLPGGQTDETGMTSCKVLEDCAPASQRFAVEVEDDAGETARFEVSIGDEKTTRNVVASFAEGRKNDWHRKAIVERFGTGGGVAGLVSLDLEALRALAPAELERLVMRL
jgi:DNA repair exonuclease SbcCD ATPase subunit